MKVGAALFALASVGLVAVTYNSGEQGGQLFLSERLNADEAAFMQYLNEFGKSYGTKEEYDFRYDIFAKMDAEINEINN